MEKITDFVLGFYRKYSDNININEAEFSKDLANYIVSLKKRIMSEEIAIYKAYEKLNLD